MTDADHIRRAIRLAQSARGRVEPNPMVGCVIVKDGQIIGEGCHGYYGGPHAEPTALAACTESTADATAYVTLEPCCHLNKQTPPCAPRLIAAKIARVVYGCTDPNPDVNGKGLAMLREAGIQVDGPILEAECKQLIAPFIRSIRQKPYVTLKWAQTADGKVAGHNGARLQISNGQTTRAVHGLRARSDVIVVGINTVLTDDPLLTARQTSNARPLIRIVMDRQLRIPTDCQLVRTARDVPLIVRCETDAYTRREYRSAELSSLGVDVRPSPKLTPAQMIKDLRWLPGRPSHLLVEPGPTLARAFFEETTLVDRVWVIRSPTKVNDVTAPTAAEVPANYVKTGEAMIGDDTLSEYLNPQSPAYFTPEPSADFLIASGQAD